MHYTKIERVGPDAHKNRDYESPYGWVILGIEQRRQWESEHTFEDQTVYIIAKKEEES